MNAVERLRRDHAILRSKLAGIECLLALGPDAWFALREMCYSLSRMLRHHMQREEDLVEACRQAMTPTAVAELSVEHREEPELWRALNRMFVSEGGHAIEHIRPALRRTIEGLRHHMDEEERELFPLFERYVIEREPAGAAAAPGSGIDETMTANHLVLEHPETRQVFERLFINLPMEGCACLDEIAWRHGITSGELIRQLESQIRQCGPARHPRSGKLEATAGAH